MASLTPCQTGHFPFSSLGIIPMTKPQLPLWLQYLGATWTACPNGCYPLYDCLKAIWIAFGWPSLDFQWVDNRHFALSVNPSDLDQSPDNWMSKTADSLASCLPKEWTQHGFEYGFNDSLVFVVNFTNKPQSPLDDCEDCEDCSCPKCGGMVGGSHSAKVDPLVREWLAS